MQSKDYYTILQIPPSATLKEIKSAYRRLAHEFHPDKNNNDQYAAARFEIIKEAYEVLSNPSKKNYYLQQRWYDRVMNRKQTDTVVTPVSVLKQFLELDRYVAQLDIHRMDKEGLYNYICHLLNDETIRKLNQFGEKDINASIVEAALTSSRPLPWKDIVSLSALLLKIKTDPAGEGQIRQFVIQSRRLDRWNKIKIWIILFIVLVLCYLIFIIGS